MELVELSAKCCRHFWTLGWSWSWETATGPSHFKLANAWHFLSYKSMLSVLFLTWKNPATDLVTLQNRLTDGGAMQSSCLCDFDTWVLRWPGYHGECFLNSHVMVPKFGCWNIMVLECRWTIKVLLPSTYLLTWEMRMLLGSEEPAMWGCAVWSTEWSQWLKISCCAQTMVGKETSTASACN